MKTKSAAESWDSMERTLPQLKDFFIWDEYACDALDEISRKLEALLGYMNAIEDELEK